MPNITRKLASVRKIANIFSIPDADMIELAIVDGWKCVVKKGEFKIGDLGIYFEIDSIVPDIPAFKFMESMKFRVRTIKLKKQISQGLMIPLKTLDINPNDVSLGDDLTDALGVLKYEPPINYNEADTKGKFPTFILKTDQERGQNLVDDIDKYRNTIFEVTEKLEGSSCTIFWNDGNFGVCSRNLEKKLTEGSKFYHVVEKNNIYSSLERFNRNIAIQSEMIGPGIQKNIYRVNDIDIRIFDVFDIDNQRYFTCSERYDVLDKLNLMDIHVPIIDHEFKINKMTMEELISYADGRSKLRETAREGIVFKSHELFMGDTFSFKMVSNKYLLKH